MCLNFIFNMKSDTIYWKVCNIILFVTTWLGGNLGGGLAVLPGVEGVELLLAAGR